MRHEYKGEYHPQWNQISDAYMAAADYRCVRCHHPFDQETRLPVFCDSRCDTDRGVHRRADHGGAGRTPEHQGRRVRKITALNSAWLDGLNYGVHHFDADKSNNRWWNLMPLCNYCHLKIQSKVIPERQWLFEHSEWMKIYVAGFYAFWFAAANPTREEAEANVDVFLALGQPWLYADRGREFLQAIDEYRDLETDEQGSEWLRNYALAQRPNGP